MQQIEEFEMPQKINLISCTNLGVILRIPGVQRDGLEVKTTVKVHGGYDVLQSRYDAFNSCDVLLLESQRSRRGWNSGRGGCGWNSCGSGHGSWLTRCWLYNSILGLTLLRRLRLLRLRSI
jgi:hypothetical protein